MPTRRLFAPALIAAVCALAVVASSAAAAATPTSFAAASNGVQHLHFKYGPIKITPGQNFIKTELRGIPQPKVDGYMVGFYPEPALRGRQGAQEARRHPARRRDPSAPRRVALGRRPPRRELRPSRRALRRRGRGEDQAAVPQGLRLRLPQERSLDPQLHDPQPDRRADDGVDHLRRRLHPGHGAAGQDDARRAADLDGRAERLHLPGLRRAARHGQERAATPTRSRPRTRIPAACARTAGRSTATAC